MGVGGAHLAPQAFQGGSSAGPAGPLAWGRRLEAAGRARSVFRAHPPSAPTASESGGRLEAAVSGQ